MPDREGDRRVLAAMANHGADLTKPAHTIHYLYFNSIDTAKQAADELRTAGFENIRTHRSPAASLWQRFFGPHQYSCIAETHAVPEEKAVFATSDWMEALSERHGGEYDGWEASIEK